MTDAMHSIFVGGPLILRIFQILTVVAPTVFYTAAKIVSSFSPTEQPAKPPTGPGKLRKAQLALIICAAIFSSAEAVIDIKISDPSLVSDPDAVYALFLSLVYVLLSIGLIDATTPVSYSHYGAWSILFLCQSAVFGLSLQPSTSQDKLLLARIILQGVQLGIISFLLALSLSFRYLPQKENVAIDDETSPLLPNENTAQAAKGGEETKEPDEEEADRLRVRNRPFWQYVASFKLFVPYMYPRSPQLQIFFAGMCLCTGLLRVITIAIPLTLGEAVNGLGDSVPWKAISIYVLLKYSASQAGLPLLEGWLAYRLNVDLTVALQRHCYDHIMNLSADFHDSKRSSVVWQIMHQGQDVINLLHSLLFQFLPQLVDLFAAIVVLSYLFGLYMTFIIATTAVMFYWLTFRGIIIKRTLRRSWLDAYHEQYYQMSESTMNWSTVSYFDRIPYEMEKYREKGDIARSKMLLLWAWDAWTRGLRHTIPCITFAAACIVAAIQIARHQLKVSDFVILITYWSQLTGPLSSIANELSKLTEKLVNAEKLVVMLEKEPKVQDAPDARPFAFLEGAVQFENVAFSYDGKRQVTKGITFRAAPGKTIALVGQTGGGKSTLLRLLFRFYDLEQGRILIDGQDIRHVELASFRKHLAMVPQNPVVFNMSIMENVRYPDIDCTDDEVMEACKAVELHDKILSFTKGYQEKVGERGTKLSGGELQRLAIARAILKKADILLLDEATSSVDSITEKKIQRSVRQLCAGKTAFVIAHRLSTILHADHILVIRDGQIVEAGTHANLIDQGGAYSELWRSQIQLQSQERSRSRSAHKANATVLINDLSGSGDDSQGLVKIASKNGKEGKEKEHSQDSDSEGSNRSHDVSHAKTDARGRTLPRRFVEALGRRISHSKSSQKGANSESVLNPDAPTFRVSRSKSPKKDGSSGPELNPEVRTFRPRRFQDGNDSTGNSAEEPARSNGVASRSLEASNKENATTGSLINHVAESSGKASEARSSPAFPLKRKWTGHGRETLDSTESEGLNGTGGQQHTNGVKREKKDGDMNGID